jgi:hypothetical protein
LSTLNRAGVDYLVIGGYAVIYHGYVRTTGDFDIWVRLDEQNAHRIVEALRDAGYNPPGLKPALFLKPGAIFRFGVPPFKIEILNQIAGVEFDPCFQRKIVHDMDGETVGFINLEDLKANKRSVGRLKDLADIENLP